MELLQLLLASIILLVTGTAVLLLLIGFFPRLADQGTAVIERSPGRALGVGVVNLLFLGTISLTLLALGQNVAPIFSLIALISLFALVGGILLGLPGLILLLGQRLWPDKRPVTRHAYAALLLLLASLAPFVGWFVLAPILLMIALGTCVMLLIGRWQQGRSLPAEQGTTPDA